ncbi:hypothetical protein ACHWQZ_G012689 [Mnemiopsis leidyi]
MKSPKFDDHQFRLEAHNAGNKLERLANTFARESQQPSVVNDTEEEEHQLSVPKELRYRGDSSIYTDLGTNDPMPAIMTKLRAHWVEAVNEGYISLELAKEVVGITESMMSSADGKPSTLDIFKPGTPFFNVFPKVHKLRIPDLVPGVKLPFRLVTNLNNQQKEVVRPDQTTPKTSNSWDEFTEITVSDLKSIFSEMNKKECDEDPIPVKLLLDCFDELTSIILFIVNDSLRTGRFPTGLKNALVRPVIKNKEGDVNSFKNYRPISNLTFLSKVIEKCDQKELSAYLEANNLHANHQSGYRANHSCETATLKIYNDLLCLSNSKNKVVLLLLDLSAAFDTVNHNILISKLKNEFGLKGEVLDWFKSYLTDRSFTVSINGKLSSKCFLKVGVPQGSILGPILFILYTKELNSIAKRHGFHIHLYADDTQLYIEFNPLYENLSNIEQRIIACFNDIKNWMAFNKLKLNQDKTEILIVQTKNNFSSWTVPSITLSEEGETLNTSPVVKSLGVLFDEFLTFENHVDAVVKSFNIHLRNLRVIGSKLNYELKKNNWWILPRS